MRSLWLHNSVDLPAWLRLGAGLALPLRLLPRQRALLVLRPGSLGDALLFSGALRALRAQFPVHRIVLVTSRRAAPIFERSPHVDALLWFDETVSGNAGICYRLKRIWLAVRITGRRYSCAINALTCGKQSTAADWSTVLLGTVKTREKITLDNKDAANRKLHELDLLVQLMQKAGCSRVNSREDIRPEIYLNDDERAWAEGAWSQTAERGSCNHKERKEHKRDRQARLSRGESHGWNANPDSLKQVSQDPDCIPSVAAAAAGLPSGILKDQSGGSKTLSQTHSVSSVHSSDGIAGTSGGKSEKGLMSKVYGLRSNHTPLRIALCPGSRFKVKDWGADNYAELLHLLGSIICGKVVLLGGDEDAARCSAIAQQVRDVASIQILNLAGKLSVHEACAVIEQSDLCIGNDTFGLHAAIAAGTPSVVLMWGGDRDQWIPWGDPDRHRMVRADVECAGCGGECRYEAPECMQRITPAMVMDSVRRLLGG